VSARRQQDPIDHLWVIGATQPYSPLQLEMVIYDAEKTMSFPMIDLGDKKVLLLSGFELIETSHGLPTIEARENLEKAAKNHNDAVAFGYVLGKWMPAA
jgi:hypothetical protein